MMERVYAQYPLNFSHEEIRLLKICPGHWDEPIRANFFIASLCKDIPEYVALSYVWGNDSEKQPSIIEGQEFHLTNNLHGALRRLRKNAQSSDAVLVIWADALCINQDDMEERNQQVRLMGKIYSQYCHVFVWLGELPVPDSRLGNLLDQNQPASVSEGEHPTARAISLDCEQILYLLAAGRHLTEIFPFNCGGISLHFKAIHGAFKFLSHNPWFTRRWVLQEAAMAPRVRVVFGVVSIDLDILSLAMKTVAVHAEKGCCASSLPDHYNLQHAIRRFLQRFNRIEELRYLKKSRLCIMDLCLRFFDYGVSEEHDRIYAMLGMVNPPSQLVPDYRTPIQDLFTSICVNHINESSSPLPLHLASLDKKTAGLPSWVIDWKVIGSVEMKTWHRLSKDSKPGGSTAQASLPVVDSHQRLHLLGWKVDQVNTISEPIGLIFQYRDDRRDPFGQDLNFQLWRSYVSAKYAWNDPYPSGGTWAAAWWRTLCADSCWGTNSARRMTAE